MSLAARKMLRVALLLGASQLLAASLLARAATNTPVSAPADSTFARPLLSSPSMPPAPPLPPNSLPPMPVLRSPISFFRELLAMSPVEQRRALTNRSPEGQKLILDKVREYQSMAADERELRLRVTELRWYLVPLMTAPATNRAAQLAMLADRDRQLVEDRLQEWDNLSPDEQKELLGIEPTLQYMAEIEGLSDQRRREILKTISPARREMLEQGITNWSALSEDQRRKMLTRFKGFFELTSPEKQRALNTLSAPERRQIEATLKIFESLPPDHRAQCIQSFAKFARLSLAERQQFLKSAERWKLMSPAERQTWRQLVQRLPPPLPPSVRRLPPPLPPLPVAARPPHPAPAMATNQN
jgi:hypothetical protein